MKKREIISEGCPEPIGPYSEGLMTGEWFFTTQIGTLPDGSMISDDSAQQAIQCLKNVETIIAAAGGTINDAVKCTVYLTSLDDFDSVNKVYKEFFIKPYPARTCIQISRLPAGARVEIEVVARIGSGADNRTEKGE